MKHIKRAAKEWKCRGCGLPIQKGETCFCELGATLPYGRYIATGVAARRHLKCVDEHSFCCLEAEREFKQYQAGNEEGDL